MDRQKIVQKSLFDLARKKVPDHLNLVDVIADVLDVNADTAYRRIRGDNFINLEEAVEICRHFGISLDQLIYDEDKMQYTFVPSDLKDINSYQAYAKDMASISETMDPTSENEINLIAADIPAFHYAKYKELSLFQLFSWDKNVYDASKTFEDFVNGIDADLIAQYSKKIFTNYQQTPSSEIWTDHTIDSTLKLIKYHFEMGDFNDVKTPLLICEQLMELMDTLQEWIIKGVKGSNNTPFKFYINEVDIGNTLIYIKNGEQIRCVVRLFTINGLNIEDELFCREVENWYGSLIKRSVLLSELSSKERYIFLTNQKQKIKTLIDFIKSSC